MERNRIRYLLGRYFDLAFALLLLVAVVSGYVAYSAYTETETVTQEEVASVATTLSEFRHGAEVQENAVVFEEGIRLEDRTLYFTSITPILNGTYLVRHGGGNPEPADARIELRMVLRSVGNDGQVYWKDTQRLTSRNLSSLEPGVPMEANFSINVTDTLERIDSIRENLSASPGSAEVLVVAESAVEGTVGNESYADVRSERMVLSPGRGTYSVSSETKGRHRYEETITVRREEETPLNLIYAYLLVLFLSLAGSAFLYRKKEEGELSPTKEEMEAVEFERERARFEDWISEGSVQDMDKKEVRMSSLEDVVDVAIDAERRVVEDGGEYVVLVDDVKYTYTPSVSQTGSDEKTPTSGDQDAEETDDETTEAEALREKAEEVEEFTASLVDRSGSFLRRSVDSIRGWEEDSEGRAGKTSEKETDGNRTETQLPSREELEEMPYRELQKLAMEEDIKANLKAEELVERLCERYDCEED